MTTDRSAALLLLRRIRRQILEIESISLPALQAVVDCAQNRPPLGEADGTLVDPEWSAMKNVVTSVRRVIDAIEVVSLTRLSRPTPILCTCSNNIKFGVWVGPCEDGNNHQASCSIAVTNLKAAKWPCGTLKYPGLQAMIAESKEPKRNP
jgi:hypothetical protein